MKKTKKNLSFFKAFLQNPKTRALAKFLLSLFVLYHLAMIFITPLNMSFLHEKTMPFFAPYASSLSLNTAWNFYAPNPSYYFYFEYEVIDDRSKVGTFRWPPDRRTSKMVYLNHNRLIYHARFFIMAGERNMRRYFVPYLCQRHPTATDIVLKVMLEKRPHFKKAKTFSPEFFSPDNQANMKEWSAIQAKCPHKNQRQNPSKKHRRRGRR